MDEKVLKHIEDSLNEVRALFMKAAVQIEAIKPGEKIPATELAKMLAKEQGMTGPQLYPTLKIVLDDFPGVVIRRGAHGGIYRPLPDEGKAVVVTDESVTDVSEATDSPATDKTE